jgi:hypothetical protein
MAGKRFEDAAQDEHFHKSFQAAKDFRTASGTGKETYNDHAGRYEDHHQETASRAPIRDRRLVHPNCLLRPFELSVSGLATEQSQLTIPNTRRKEEVP